MNKKELNPIIVVARVLLNFIGALLISIAGVELNNNTLLIAGIVVLASWVFGFVERYDY